MHLKTIKVLLVNISLQVILKNEEVKKKESIAEGVREKRQSVLD